jgi:hypothetical protein
MTTRILVSGPDTFVVLALTPYSELTGGSLYATTSNPGLVRRKSEVPRPHVNDPDPDVQRLAQILDHMLVLWLRLA